jgi:glycosyltransferase involved in cell wall biosynthesis
MFVSVVIPTYNRRDSLQAVLHSLARQTYPRDKYEVIVVDDGSMDDTPSIANEEYPFSFRYVRQPNRGDAIARNLGAQESKADLLIFLDDDITVVPDFVASMIREHQGHERLIVVGTLQPVVADQKNPFQKLNAQIQNDGVEPSEKIDFTECLSGILSLRRDDYLQLGMMQPLTNGGSSVWCDVDLAYRARLQGFSFKRSAAAIGYHDDFALRDLPTYCQRMQRAAKSAVPLFQRYLDLEPHIPMFRDKGYISWRKDPPRLICRKLARQIASTRPALWGMEQIVSVLEQRYPSPILLRSLYRWIIGGYIFRGYRQGLRECEGH